TPYSSGTAAGEIDLPRSGEYGIWLGGSLRGNVEISVDGKSVATAGTEIDHSAQYRELATVQIEAGPHRIALTYEEPGPLAPGAGGERFAIGPLVLSTTTAADARVEVVGVGEAGSLCGRALDWVEALPY
ncbi:MAG TPA: hypothetical protein VFS26_10890, partial [Solirubrobacterales bacterium]|nr:hypothetical protein [Solirubrobacterales bacterium]